jgi:hypothetical protein
MTSHCTRGSVTTLHDFGGVLGQPLDTLFWALTISWSRLLARMCEVAIREMVLKRLIFLIKKICHILFLKSMLAGGGEAHKN